MSWQEEVDSILQDLEVDYLSEDEAREQIKEIEDQVPEDELEAVWSRFERAALDRLEHQYLVEMEEEYAALSEEEKREILI
tara:strand:- start:99 stop:341 length:243 start_codon:yes stop_codon:yes gene_type:complete